MSHIVFADDSTIPLDQDCGSALLRRKIRFVRRDGSKPHVTEYYNEIGDDGLHIHIDDEQRRLSLRENGKITWAISRKHHYNIAAVEDIIIFRRHELVAMCSGLAYYIEVNLEQKCWPLLMVEGHFYERKWARGREELSEWCKLLYDKYIAKFATPQGFRTLRQLYWRS